MNIVFCSSKTMWDGSVPEEGEGGKEVCEKITLFPVQPSESYRSWSGMNMIKFGFSTFIPLGLGGYRSGGSILETGG